MNPSSSLPSTFQPSHYFLVDLSLPFELTLVYNHDMNLNSLFENKIKFYHIPAHSQVFAYLLYLRECVNPINKFSPDTISTLLDLRDICHDKKASFKSWLNIFADYEVSGFNHTSLITNSFKLSISESSLLTSMMTKGKFSKQVDVFEEKEEGNFVDLSVSQTLSPSGSILSSSLFASPLTSPCFSSSSMSSASSSYSPSHSSSCSTSYSTSCFLSSPIQSKKRPRFVETYDKPNNNEELDNNSKDPEEIEDYKISANASTESKQEKTNDEYTNQNLTNSPTNQWNEPSQGSYDYSDVDLESTIYGSLPPPIASSSTKPPTKKKKVNQFSNVIILD